MTVKVLSINYCTVCRADALSEPIINGNKLKNLIRDANFATMNREEIKSYLPHREPMLLLDDVAIEGDTAVGHYLVRGDEYFLQGHFPERPIVPGVVLCEIMAQSSALLVRDELQGRLALYTGLDNIRFRAEVHPNETIEIRSRITARRGTNFFIDASATVTGRKVCDGRLSFKIVDR